LRPFDANGTFLSAADAGDKLRFVAVRGAGVTVFSSILGLAVQIIATVVLARILTPGDFGVVAMVTTFSLLLMNFGLNGFTEAVLQREVIDHALASNLFWINLGIGSFLTIGFAAKDTLSNIMAGFLIFWDKPFHTDDWVTLGANYGKVTEITMRTTRLRTWNNTLVIIPNETIINPGARESFHERTHAC